MEWSPLEKDLLSDMAEDSYGIWEVFSYVRYHYPNASEFEVGRIGANVLAQWHAAGWLLGLSADDATLSPAAFEALMRNPLAYQHGPGADAPRLFLTDRGIAEVRRLESAT